MPERKKKKTLEKHAVHKNFALSVYCASREKVIKNTVTRSHGNYS